MGYYRPQTVTRYLFPSSTPEEEYWFDWKNFVSYGETKALSKKLLEDAKAAGIKPEDMAGDQVNAAMALSYIAAWNIPDAAGIGILPLVPESLDKLQDIDAAVLMEMLRARVDVKATERKN